MSGEGTDCGNGAQDEGCLRYVTELQVLLFGRLRYGVGVLRVDRTFLAAHL